MEKVYLGQAHLDPDVLKTLHEVFISKVEVFGYLSCSYRAKFHPKSICDTIESIHDVSFDGYAS